jgi:MFS-type transporter involved in bile tolerance (Atg22 family)
MRRRIYWSLGLGIVGLLLSEKQTYWLPGTYLRDIRTLALAVVGCAVAGFLLGCIAERTVDERHGRTKILYWLVVMAIFGSFLGLGKGVPIDTTVTVFAWTLGVGFGIGALQYFLQRPKTGR